MAKRYDLVIVGMGSGGLVAARFAATIGVRTALVERGRFGGDCLWTGCVPSKALLASAKVAEHMRTAERFGLAAVAPTIDTARVWERMRSIQDEIAATDDNPEQFEAMGLEVVHGEGRLTGPNTVEAGSRTLESRFILLCTGSRPAVPPVAGLAEAGFLTSESIFELERSPRSFVILGGGPIAVELAQALNRLGIAVILLQKGPRLLPRDEPSLVEGLTRALREEGVDVRLEVRTDEVTVADGLKTVLGVEAGRPGSWQAEELLVAAGRKPNVEVLGLESAGVRVGSKGIEVDGRMRTNVPSIYAAGDLAGRFLFTHAAAHESVQAVRDMFFPGRGKAVSSVPWCTFTDPELAHAGLTVAEAEARHGRGKVEVRRIELSHSDRARAEGTAGGAIVLVAAAGRLVGAHALAPAAGELIHELALAIRKRLKLRELAGLVHVYPTISTSIVMLASEAAYERARRFRWLVRRTA